MSLLHLPTIPVPPELSHVDGCSCSGLDWHLQDCTIFSVPADQAMAAIAAAHQRMRDHADRLTRQLHAELATLRKGEPT
jgi:hypothetical protein